MSKTSFAINRRNSTAIDGIVAASPCSSYRMQFVLDATGPAPPHVQNLNGHICMPSGHLNPTPPSGNDDRQPNSAPGALPHDSDVAPPDEPVPTERQPSPSPAGGPPVAAGIQHRGPVPVVVEMV